MDVLILRNIFTTFIIFLFYSPAASPPPTILHLSDVWRGEGGGFSRTFNIFFFIHCTAVCLYRILIAQKKQFPVFAVKITFLMKKFLRQNKFRVVFAVASEHYFLMFYHTINNPESRHTDLYITKPGLLLVGLSYFLLHCIHGIFSIWQLFSIHVLTTP